MAHEHKYEDDSNHEHEHEQNDRAGVLSGMLRKRRFSIAGPYIRGRVLDFGSHHGPLTALCRPGAYLGVEHDAEFIATARALHPDFSFVTELPREVEFDTVVALAVIEHVPDPGGILKQLAAVLAPEGRVVLTTPHPHFEWIHTAGARVGLFSQHAHDDHEDLIDRAAMAGFAASAGLTIETYRRFLFGANQLFVLRAAARG